MQQSLPYGGHFFCRPAGKGPKAVAVDFSPLCMGSDNFLNFPLDRRRRLVRNIVHRPVDVCGRVHDAARRGGQHLARQARPVGGHKIRRGDGAQRNGIIIGALVPMTPTERMSRGRILRFRLLYFYSRRQNNIEHGDTRRRQEYRLIMLCCHPKRLQNPPRGECEHTDNRQNRRF